MWEYANFTPGKSLEFPEPKVSKSQSQFDLLTNSVGDDVRLCGIAS